MKGLSSISHSSQESANSNKSSIWSTLKHKIAPRRSSESKRVPGLNGGSKASLLKSSGSLGSTLRPSDSKTPKPAIKKTTKKVANEPLFAAPNLSVLSTADYEDEEVIDEDRVPSFRQPIAIQPRIKTSDETAVKTRSLFQTLFASYTSASPESPSSSTGDLPRMKSGFFSPTESTTSKSAQLSRKAASTTSLDIHKSEPLSSYKPHFMTHHNISVSGQHSVSKAKTISRPASAKVPPKQPVTRRSSEIADGRTKSTHVVKETKQVDTPSSNDALKSTLDTLKRLYGVSTIEGMINQYVMVKAIGDGSFGKVWLVFDTDSKRYYACKAISKKRLRQKSLWRSGPTKKKLGASTATTGGPTTAGGQATSSKGEATKRFDFMDFVRYEIAILKKLSRHPHISTLVEVLDDQKIDMLYLVFELCEYGAIMRLKPNETVQAFPEVLCRRYFRDAILGLEYLHSMKIVHRDIKPDNILLTATNHAVIGDFSISFCNSDLSVYQADGTKMNTTGQGSAFPETGNGIFTPAFTPPELIDSTLQQLSAKNDYALDLWALGITLYCFFHGHVPFEADSVDETYNQIVHASIDPLIRSDCSFVLRDLLQRLLEKNPVSRITLAQVRKHPWVTRQGADPLPQINLDEHDVTDAELANAVQPAQTFLQKMRAKVARRLTKTASQIMEGHQSE